MYIRWHPQTGEHKFFEDSETAPPDWLPHHPDDTAKTGAQEQEQEFGQKQEILREDGPTVEEFVKAGYSAKNYPPSGYASRSTPEEVAAAIAAEKGKKAA